MPTDPTPGRVLCVIPARGGSKGLPGKNLRPLGGLPLIAWACRAARATPGLDRVVVSTDDPAIAAAAEAAGVPAPFLRDAALAQDRTPVVEVLADAVRRMESVDGARYDWVCLLQATSPLVQPDDITRALERARATGADTVLSVYPAGQKHPEIMLHLEPDGRVRWFCEARQRMARRQDLPPVFVRSGLVYVVRRDLLLGRGTLYGDAVYAVEVPAARALSIDTAADLRVAEALLETAAPLPPPAPAAALTRDFETQWRARAETAYVHWTRGAPRNQIQLAFRQHWELFCELLGRTRGEGRRALEVGCGRGSMSCYFADAGYDCTLLDNAPAAMEQARRLYADLGLNAHFVVGDALRMPFPNGAFDVIYSIGLLEHFPEIGAPLREQARVLRPGGTLLVYVVPEKRVRAQERDQWVNRLLRAWPGAAPEAGPAKAPLFRTAFPSADYAAELRRLGLADVRASGVYPLPMISLSPGFPFTLLPPPCEAELVAEFLQRLAQRRAATGRHPWLCDEDEGQAFLVWGIKPEETAHD